MRVSCACLSADRGYESGCGGEGGEHIPIHITHPRPILRKTQDPSLVRRNPEAKPRGYSRPIPIPKGSNRNR
ncbi:hypothetical protein L6304_05730 [bacterium]|nr:hypothetical protein [bacterium]MBU4561278.1 hypothetical protein [bacterium]MCG2676657.1 hypothetical protein [bacterium]